MSLSYTHPWKKSLILSLCLHLVLLTVAAYLAPGLTAPLPPEESLLEMELAAGSPEMPAADLPEQITEPESATALPANPVETEVPVQPAAMTHTPMTSSKKLPSSSAGYPGPAVAATGGGNIASAAAVPAAENKGIAAPSVLSRTTPAYPSVARQAGQEGTVLLQVEILLNGRAGQINIIRSSGYPSLDEAAVQAVRQWQFVPAKNLQTGKNITCATTLPVSFRLH